MKRLDSIPDWVIPVLTVLLVAGVFKLFGGIGVLVLAIISTVIWIAQTRMRVAPLSAMMTSQTASSGSQRRSRAISSMVPP